MSNDEEEESGTCDRNVQSAHVTEEANHVAWVGSDAVEDDDVLLLALERVHSLDCHISSLPLQQPLLLKVQFVAFVWRYHSNRYVRNLKEVVN